MEFCGERWDPDIRYVCRVVALDLCKSFGHTDIHDLALVDGMISGLLISEDELLTDARPFNLTPC
jgi:hypothetical protein